MLKYDKGPSIIRQPPNPTLFSGPIECRIREVSLYTVYHIERNCHGQLAQIDVQYSGTSCNKLP